MALILASSSLRRKQLLSDAGFTFAIHHSQVNEVADGEPEAVVKENALRKARDASALYKNDVVLAGDTIVVLGSRILGKPRDDAEAVQMLQKLSGKEHQVVSCIVATQGGRELSRIVRTTVKFRKLAEDEILDYVKTGEPLDKAGAYAIQGGAAVFVESYEGCYQNVVGFSIPAVKELLEELGFEM